QVPAYTERARDHIVDLIYRFDQTFGLLGGGRGKSPSTSLTNWLIGPAASSPSPRPQSTASPAGSPQATPPATETIAASPPKLTTAERQRIQAYVEKQMPNLQQALPTLAEKFSGILKKSIGGFLGVTGFLLSLILVPIYLFFLLNEKPRIQARWKEYLPLRASPLRDEVAELLSEINRYVTANSRGHILRSANCRKLRRFASDDSDRVDLSLGSDHWRSNRSPPRCAAYGNSKGPAGAVRLGPAPEGASRRNDRSISGS